MAATFWEHLEELRIRILRSFAAVLIFSFIFYNFSPRLVDFLIKPIGKAVFTSPAEALLVHIAVAFWAGVFVSVPLIAFELWRFVESGFERHEKSHAIKFGILAFLLFLTGIIFGYFVFLPVVLNIFLSFARPNLVPMISVKNYIDFVISTVLGCGFVFETPLLALFLAKAGLIDAQFLIRYRRAAILIIFIVAAILTPPDVVSQFCMAVPLLVFYELSIILVKLYGKK
jgi:sec-independent protein translocase protein TatC